MKRLSAYLLLLIMIIISVSACGSTSTPPVAATTTYLTVQVRADAGDGEVTLDWQMVAGATTYNSYYIADPTGTYSSTNKPSSATMKAGTKISSIISATKTITGLTNGTTYWFAISAVTSSVESDLSIAISATPSTTTIPAAPENVRANAGNEQVTVTWTPVAGVDHYTVYCYVGVLSTLNMGIVDHIPQANSSQVVDSATIDWTQGSNVGSSPNAGLVNGTTYYFVVVSVNAIGNTNTSFFYSATPSTTPPPFAPDLTSVSAGNAQITVNWNAVSASPAVASYNIYIGTAKGVTKSSGAKTSITADANPTYSATASVTNGTTYYIVVTAVNSNGESAESNEMSATPL
jgi:cellulose 1,4-beta-cellobiosidase